MYKNKNLIKQRDLLLPRLMSCKLKVDIESNNERKETNIVFFEVGEFDVSQIKVGELWYEIRN